MKSVRTLLYFIVSVLLLSSCSKDENAPYDLKFVHIMDNESSTVTVSEKANAIGTYSVYVSTSQFLSPITVTYKITVGNGLTQGVDYDLVNAGTELTFLPGIYDMPVRIKWKANPVDPARDNTITIDIIGVSDPAFTIGLPGKGQYQKSLVITKIP